LIVGGAVAVYRYQIRTGPRAQRKAPPRQAKLVQVVPVKKEDCITTVRAMGTVVPARQVALQPQVTGQIVDVTSELLPGGIVRAGHRLIAIDARDYRILLEQRQSDVVRAQKDLKLEQGNQAVARQEYELLGEVVTEEDRELVLREPHLASVQAALESAEAAVEKARLDLARCDINVPFNAIVQDKHIDVGATVTTNSQLVTLTGTDEAWIELKVKIDELKWLNIPQQDGDSGSGVKVYDDRAWGPDAFRTGRVLRLCGQLQSEAQMARLLVVVDDPFCLKPENRELPKLLMGSIVSAEIQGRTLASVFPIDPSYIHDDDTVWIMNSNELHIRPVRIAFSGPDHVYVSEGLTENEQLVVTDIAAPVPGMPLRVAPTDDETLHADPEPAKDKGGR
jgi:RND family efflux transporter MFP subunit